MNLSEYAVKIDDPQVKVEEELRLAFKRFENLDNEDKLITVSIF